ncbi:ParB N-terminal domain-containing protein [Rhodococcus hoagii]|nr:ParB N-terminal domain-containing protein [Prescottella equi]
MTNTESLELVTVDPTTLLVDTNIRADLRLTKGFLQSIAEHGVMTPPTAVRTADGQLRVRTGHRRTAAAVHNGLAAIPVLVIGDEATDDAATLDRLATQWAENEHRTGLDHADKVDTVEQMSLLGVPAGQIAKRLKTTRREVAAAVAVAQNDTARSHLAERDLTLDEAAAFAEFSDDPDAIASLEHAIDTGRLAHVAQSLRDRRAEHAAALEAGSAYAAEGITIYTEHPAYGTGPRALHSLVDADGNEATRETVPTEHLAAYMQGRVAYLDKETGDEIDEDTIDFTAGPDDEPDEGLRHPDTVDINHDGYRPVWYCTDPTAAGLRDRYGRNTNTATADDSDTGKADRAAETPRRHRQQQGMDQRRNRPPRMAHRPRRPQGRPEGSCHLHRQLTRRPRPTVRRLPRPPDPQRDPRHHERHRHHRTDRQGQRSPRPAPRPGPGPRRPRGRDRQERLAHHQHRHRHLPPLSRIARLHPQRDRTPRLR